MKIILSFIIFGALAILVPPIISTMMPADTAEYQIMQGADPTQILEQTASGKIAPNAMCDSGQYLFGKSKNGYLYIRDLNSDVLASVIESKLVLFLVENGFDATLLNVADSDPRLDLFGAVLGQCKVTEQAPVRTNLVLDVDLVTLSPENNN